MPDLLTTHFEQDTCPHCGIAHPNLARVSVCVVTKDHRNLLAFRWAIYACSSCGRGVLVGAVGDTPAIHPYQNDSHIIGVYPASKTVSDDVPQVARRYLEQALRSLNSPDGAVMLSASAVDAMLK